jgi:RPA family protein
VARSREVAWRIFADEYNSSSVEERGEGEYAPNHVITPLGAMVNRVYVIGVLTDLENIGTDEEPLYRARMQDPTGIFYVSAGQYQPEAAKALAALKTPAFIAMVAKTRTYSPEEGVVYVSLRPEVVKQVGAEERELWVLEAARSTLRRVAAMRDLAAMETPSADELVRLGHGQRLAAGALKAREAYGEVDVDRYERVVLDALRFLLSEEAAGELALPEPETVPEDALGDLGMEAAPPRAAAKAPPKPTLAAPAAAPAAAAAPAPTEGGPPKAPRTEEEMDDVVLGLVRELDEGAKGAAYDAILERARERGMDRDAFEETINRLLDQGLIYEPILGQIKLI